MSDLEYSDNEIEEEIIDDIDKDEILTSKIKKNNLVKKTISNEEDIEDDDDEDDEDDEEDDFSNEELEQDIDNYTQEKEKNFDMETSNISPINSDVESDDDEIFQKFDIEKRKDYINKYHPECFTANSSEIEILCKIERDSNNIIIDENHQTTPILSKYEKTRILGQRAKQINSGHKALVKVPNNVIDGYLIAKLELEEKLIPIIIRRPLPNGKSEYWKIKDLEII